MGTTTAGMTVAEAVTLVNEAIRELAVGPEQVIAVDPAEVTVDWDAWLTRSRCSKMSQIRSVIRCELSRRLHQMPEVLLVAEDGAVTGLYRWDDGTKVGA
jgi:hypothetical protein